MTKILEVLIRSIINSLNKAFNFTATHRTPIFLRNNFKTNNAQKSSLRSRDNYHNEHPEKDISERR